MRFISISFFVVGLTISLESNCAYSHNYSLQQQIKNNSVLRRNINISLIDINDYEKPIKQIFKNTIPEFDFYSPVYLVDTKSFGLYLDFIGNGGYAIIDKEFIYDCDLEIFLDININDKLIYETSTGIGIINNNEIEYLNIPERKAAKEIRLDKSYINSKGEINDITSYIYYNYPNYELAGDYVFTKSYTSYMFDTSLYCLWRNNSAYPSVSEGNCAMNAIYNMLRNLYVCQNFLDEQTYLGQKFHELDYAINFEEVIENDVLFNEYGTGTKTEIKDGTTYTWKPNNLTTISNLYLIVRNAGLEYDFSPDTGFDTRIWGELLTQDIGFLCGVNLDARVEPSPAFALENAQKGIPSVISISGSKIYGNHAVTMFGYYTYSYEEKVLWWTEKKFSNFYQIDSGWNGTKEIINYNDQIWLDPAGLNLSFLTIDEVD